MFVRYHDICECCDKMILQLDQTTLTEKKMIVQGAVNEIRRIYRLPTDGTVTNELFQKMLRDYENPPDAVMANS